MFVDLILPGTPRNASPLKPCDGPCQGAKSPEGGVQVTRDKWLCAGCWRSKNSRKK